MAEPLRTMIVDDEPAAVRRLVRLCDALPAVAVVATAGDGTTAFELLHTTAVDLILLDIEMPGLSGLALAERLVGREPAPAIVFVTAFDRFAIQAFALDAVGYLLKPVDPDLLRATIDRVTRRVSSPVPEIQEDAVFWAPHRGTLVRIAAMDIDRITGEDDYARLHCGDKSYLVAERLYAIERRLDDRRFLRVHRSALVARDRIAALEFDAGNWSVRLSTGGLMPIGRSFLSSVRSRLRVAE